MGSEVLPFPTSSSPQIPKLLARFQSLLEPPVVSVVPSAQQYTQSLGGAEARISGPARPVAGPGVTSPVTLYPLPERTPQ